MELNWAQTDEAVMDNPLGGITRGWAEIKAVYARIFSDPEPFWFEFYDYSCWQRPKENTAMNIFVTGATGVMGRSLVPQLVAAGHSVAALSRAPRNAELLERMGAQPVSPLLVVDNFAPYLLTT